jgi:hypothetical protein
MKELSKLKSLVEAKMPSGEEVSRRNFFNRAEKSLEQVESILTGSVLKKLLSDGQYPESETKSLIKAFNKLMAEFEDLKMSMLNEFDEE